MRLTASAPNPTAVVSAEMTSGSNPKDITAIYDGYDNASYGITNYSGWLDGENGAKEAGKMRLEGKDYVVRDGDVMHFRFAT